MGIDYYNNYFLHFLRRSDCQVQPGWEAFTVKAQHLTGDQETLQEKDFGKGVTVIMEYKKRPYSMTFVQFKGEFPLSYICLY